MAEESAQGTEKSQMVCPTCGIEPQGAVTCPACGTNLAYTRLVSRATWETRQARDEGDTGSPSPVVIRKATYLGGHPRLGDQRVSDLEITVDDRGWTATRSVSVDSSGRETRQTRFSLPWEEIRTMEVEVGGRHALARRLVLAGVVGALTSKTKVFVLLGTADGEAFFEIHSRHPERIRAQLSPWTKTGPERIPQSGAATSAPDADSLVRRLHELADLRDRGVLQPEEFERLKSQLLSDAG